MTPSTNNHKTPAEQSAQADAKAAAAQRKRELKRHSLLPEFADYLKSLDPADARRVIAHEYEVELRRVNDRFAWLRADVLPPPKQAPPPIEGAPIFASLRDTTSRAEMM
jgi:hypothetical protein